jgi:hypothetical protein
MADPVHRCPLCGDFHFSPEFFRECDECLRVVQYMRSQIESRGGAIVVVDGRIVVRTHTQLLDPSESIAHLRDVRRSLNEMRPR